MEAAGEHVRGRTAEVSRDVEAMRGTSEQLRAGIIEGIKKPQQAIYIAENAVKTGNIQNQSDFELLKGSWVFVKPYLSQEVIAALEPLMLKGPSPTAQGAPPPPPQPTPPGAPPTSPQPVVAGR